MPEHPLDKLTGLMDKLRSPDGCPWDREQTHKTLKKYIIEEVYEFIEAVDEQDYSKMKDELGDLLFQIIFHCRLAKEENRFDITDVIEYSMLKMIRRHPHVFGETKLNTACEVVDQWDKIKKNEHNHKHRESILDGIPIYLPSLMRASKVQKKAAKAGFDWDKPDQIIEKIHEELTEVSDEIKTGNADRIKEEIGDLFFAVANLARFFGYDPEELSQKAVNKFISRFKKVEKEILESGKTVEQTSLAEMDSIWNKHKTQS